MAKEVAKIKEKDDIKKGGIDLLFYLYSDNRPYCYSQEQPSQ